MVWGTELTRLDQRQHGSGPITPVVVRALNLGANFQTLGFEHALDGVALRAGGLGIDDDLELHGSAWVGCTAAAGSRLEGGSERLSHGHAAALPQAFGTVDGQRAPDEAEGHQAAGVHRFVEQEHTEQELQ